MDWQHDTLAAGTDTAKSAPTADAVRRQLDRILGSPAFSNAPSLSRLLEHLVEQALSGQPDPLKEYAIGVDVFGRSDSFDPRTDTIVRVQARRLRAKLEEYYAASAARIRSSSRSRRGTMPRVSERPTPRCPAGGHLPASCTPLIGRERELAALKALLLSASRSPGDAHRCGGSGKTRLALQVASEVTAEFAGGVHFVSLAFVTDAEGLVSTISQTLGLRQTGGKPLVEALIAHAQQRVRLTTLLLLDSFEHLVATAPLLVRLLEACGGPGHAGDEPRGAARVGGARYTLPPLPLPNPAGRRRSMSCRRIRGRAVRPAGDGRATRRSR